MSEAWVLMVSTILDLLSQRELTPESAERWLTHLVEFAEVTYA